MIEYASCTWPSIRPSIDATSSTPSTGQLEVRSTLSPFMIYMATKYEVEGEENTNKDETADDDEDDGPSWYFCFDRMVGGVWKGFGGFW